MMRLFIESVICKVIAGVHKGIYEILNGIKLEDPVTDAGMVYCQRVRFPRPCIVKTPPPSNPRGSPPPLVAHSALSSL